MKKTLLALGVASLLATSAYANSKAYPGYYIQAEAGIAKMEVKEHDLKIKENNFNQRVTLGYDFGDVRLGLDYTNYDELENKVIDGQDKIDAKIKMRSIGLTTIYEVNSRDSNFSPYIGARLTANTATNKVDFSNPNTSLKQKVSKTKMGAGVLAGVEYRITDGVYMNVGGEYEYLGKYDNVKVQQFGGRLGFRYVF